MPITIDNYLGGEYHLTVDDVVKENNKLLLRECKHSKRSFPSTNDIRDGLLKMIVYVNICELFLNSVSVKFKPALRLTATKMIGSLTEKSAKLEIEKFILDNSLKRLSSFIFELINEAKTNNFGLLIEQA